MSYSRFEAMELLGKRLTDDALVILSLGGAVDEWYNAAPHMREASLFQQQLGCVSGDLAAIARGAGVEKAFTAHTLEEFDAHCAAGLAATEPYIVVAKTDGILQPGIKRKHSDGREDKYIFVRHVEKIEGITIMGPSEHN